MKKFVGIVALLLTIVLTFMTGCAGNTTGNMSVDENLRMLAHDESQGLAEWSNLKGGLKLQKLNNRYELIDVESGMLVYYIDRVDKFYKPENPYDDFAFETEDYELSSKDLKELERAKELVCGYIDESLEFDEEEKESLKSAVHNVTICYGRTVGEENNGLVITPMRTHYTTIYLTKGAEKYFTVATFLHELVHVISNVSNEGSENEFSFYRFCGINEGITELITRYILINAGMKNKILEDVSYEVYFPYVCALMDKVDLIHGYFHSEDIDIIFENLDRDWVDAYYMLVEWVPVSELYYSNSYPYWAYSQF